MSSTVLDELLNPVSQCLDAESARRLADFDLTAVTHRRINDLAERVNEGLATEEERSEYEAAINAVDFISILVQKARKQLAGA